MLPLAPLTDATDMPDERAQRVALALSHLSGTEWNGYA